LGHSGRTAKIIAGGLRCSRQRARATGAQRPRIRSHAGMVMEYSMVMTTCANRAEGETLAEGIIRSKLATCVQITEVSSVYDWEGEFKKQKEFLLLIKGRKDLFPMLKKYLLANHCYEVPELLQVDITNGNPTHLAYELGG